MFKSISLFIMLCIAVGFSNTTSADEPVSCSQVAGECSETPGEDTVEILFCIGNFCHVRITTWVQFGDVWIAQTKYSLETAFDELP